jgi:hypothetical protein
VIKNKERRVAAMEKYIIYGVVEPETRRIVYIDFYLGNENYINISDKEFFNDAVEKMQEENNSYWRDLDNMWHESMGMFDVKTKIVALDILNDDSEVYEIMNAYRRLFRPKYCVRYENKNNFSLDEYISRYVY